MKRDATIDETIDRIPDHYRRWIDRRERPILEETDLRASVVVVTYRTEPTELRRTVDALANQTIADFETIIVDNGDQGDLDSMVETYDAVQRYVKLRENRGVTFARNLGAIFACSNLLVFLDDDGIPRRDFVEQHVLAHRERDIVAAQGKVLPRTENVYNRLQWWYDLGDGTGRPNSEHHRSAT